LAKKARVPRPPVQAPKQRGPKRSGPSLPGWPIWAWIAIGGGVAVIAIVAVVLATSGGGTKLPLAPLSSVGPLKPAPSAGATGPEGVPIPNAPALAPPGYIKPGQSVDGIPCGATEMLTFHIHAHLTIFVTGAARKVPAGIGIAPPRTVQNVPGYGSFVTGGSCFAWLHTHAADGIVHIEAPSPETYTLGNFFDVWGEPLSSDQVGPAHGAVTAFFNGKVWTGDPRAIPLQKHAQIQLMVGKPLVEPVQVTFPNGL
jgi:hypothetical protein